VFIAASEAFSQKNTNRTFAEGLARAGKLTKVARAESLDVRGYISTKRGLATQH